MDYPTPPSANPTKYCRFCYSQFQIKPLFAVNSADQNQNLVSRILSLIQISLDPARDGASAICRMCQKKIEELELFRDRCQKLHEAIRQSRPFPAVELQLEKRQDGSVSQNDLSTLRVLIEPLNLDDYKSSRVEDNYESEEETALNETCKSLNATDLSIVTNPDDIKKNKRFWEALTRDVGSIPDHVRHTLELAGRCREASLGFISPSTIKRIEESMRQSVQMLANREELRGTDLKQAMMKYYGEAYWDHPERFCFSSEEKGTILSISSAIQQKGIRHYLKLAKVQHEKMKNGTELAQMLATKIREYYQQRDSGTEKFKAFFKQLPKTQHCPVYREANGAISATIRCPACKKKSKVTLTAGTKCWCIQNFLRHCERKHYQLEVNNFTGKGRPRSNTPKPERTSQAGRSRSKSKSLGLSIMGEEEQEEEEDGDN